MDTIINLLRKIKKLADEGIDGECRAAQDKLELLLKKHNLTLEDIADQSVTWHDFRYRNKMEKTLLLQCAVYIMQTYQIDHAINTSKKAVGFRITKAQAVDIESMYTHSRRELNKELDFFFSAFLHRHHIFGPQNGDKECTLSLDEIERLMMMTNGMNSKNWQNRKQIG